MSPLFRPAGLRGSSTAQSLHPLDLDNLGMAYLIGKQAQARIRGMGPCFVGHLDGALMMDDHHSRKRLSKASPLNVASCSSVPGGGIPGIVACSSGVGGGSSPPNQLVHHRL
jgi:hypothetical protein